MSELLSTRGRGRTGPSVVGGWRRVPQRVAVGVEAGRRRVGRRRWLVGRPLRVAASMFAAVSSTIITVAALLVSAIAIPGAVLSRRRTRGRAMVFSSSIASSAIATAVSASSMVLGAVVALARVTSAV